MPAGHGKGFLREAPREGATTALGKSWGYRYLDHANAPGIDASRGERASNRAPVSSLVGARWTTCPGQSSTAI